PQLVPSGAAESQVAEQQSPFNWFPSSHISPGSSTPFPHRLPAMSTGYGKTATGHSATAVKVRASGATVPGTVIVFPQQEDSIPPGVTAAVVDAMVPVVWSEGQPSGHLVEADSADPACVMKSEQLIGPIGGEVVRVTAQGPLASMPAVRLARAGPAAGG